MTCCRYKTSGEVEGKEGDGGGGVDFGFVVGCWVGAIGVTAGKLFVWLTFWFDLQPNPKSGNSIKIIKPSERVWDISDIV